MPLRQWWLDPEEAHNASWSFLRELDHFYPDPGLPVSVSWKPGLLWRAGSQGTHIRAEIIAIGPCVKC